MTVKPGLTTDTDPAYGTVAQRGDRYVLRFERHLRPPITRVWASLTEPEQLAAWLAEADIDLVAGGNVVLRWLNTDQNGNQAVAQGRVTQLVPPRLLEIDTDLHGTLRWELTQEETGCRLIFTSLAALPAPWLPLVLAGWHAHLDFLADALGGRPVDWPNWPLGHWEALHAAYIAHLARAEHAIAAD